MKYLMRNMEERLEILCTSTCCVNTKNYKQRELTNASTSGLYFCTAHYNLSHVDILSMNHHISLPAMHWNQ